jgi:hypothetical protein
MGWAFSVFGLARNNSSNKIQMTHVIWVIEANHLAET